MNSNSQISDFQFNEKISYVTVSGILSDLNAITVAVPRWLQERRIYLYIEVLTSSTFRFDANVLGYNNGKAIISLPASIADFPVTANQSVATAFNAGGSPVGDSLVIRLAAPFVANINSAVIQPVRINGEIDNLVLSIKGLSGTGITAWRGYLACISTKF